MFVKEDKLWWDKMKKIIALLFLLMFASGCGSIGGGEGKIPFSYEAIHTGTDGVRINFLANAPPSELLAPSKEGDLGYPFRIGLNVNNKGASPVENGWLAVTAEADYLQLDDFKRSFSLDGKSILNPGGSTSIEIFNGMTKNFKEGQAEKYMATILATSCYKYNTEFKSDVCVDTDVLDLKRKERICSIRTITSGSQGAPVAVFSVETKMFPEGGSDRIAFVKPQFVIGIRNVGDGYVVNPELDMASVCSSELVANRNSDSFRTAWNIMTVSAKLSDKELTCFPNPVKLRESDNFVRCSLKDGDKIDANIPSYMSPLTITLTYGYTSTVSKDVLISKDINY